MSSCGPPTATRRSFVLVSVLALVGLLQETDGAGEYNVPHVGDETKLTNS